MADTHGTHRTHAGNLRIGTSGWSYPTGKGTWNGIFYPKGRGKGKKFDELAYYAEHFDTVEVNSSFYHPPTADTARSWVRRTPPGFEFSMKLYQKFTHPKMFKEAQLKRAPGAEGAMLDLLAQVTQSDIDEIKRGLDPIASAGKLGALLAQFPPSFKDSPASRDYLHSLLRVFADYRVAVELRHKSWSDRLGETLTLLNDFNAAWVQIDEPKFQFSIRQNYLPNITGFYYLRLHGRNVKNWWHHGSTEDRYNYLYSKEELEPFAEVAIAVRSLVKKMYLYTNNHFAAKSVANAIMVKDRVGLPITGTYPQEFAEAYPDVAGVLTGAGATAGNESESEVSTTAGRKHARDSEPFDLRPQSQPQRAVARARPAGRATSRGRPSR